MKIIITWATWFIGRHVLSHFDNWENTIYAFWRNKLECTSPDIVDNLWDIRFPLEVTLPTSNIDVFIHIAGDTDYTRKQSDILETNVHSMRNILDVADRYMVKHFIYISSSSVYQWISWHIWEEYPIQRENLTNSYALSKYLAEQKLFKELNPKIKLSILRPRAVYGKWDHLLLPTILYHSFMKRLIMFWDGDIQTSLTHVENLCEAISVVLENQTENRCIFNVADRDTMKLNDVYTSIWLKHKKVGVISLPIMLLGFLEYINKNKFSYIKDVFNKEKVLDISKIQNLGYDWCYSFNSFINR